MKLYNSRHSWYYTETDLKTTNSLYAIEREDLLSPLLPPFFPPLPLQVNVSPTDTNTQPDLFHWLQKG